MIRFIEVVGVGRYTESVVQYRAYLTVEVNDARVDAATREATALRVECIRRIRESGITDQELREGGAEVARHWSSKEEAEKTHDARQRLLISCDDPQRLMRAISSVDSLFTDTRYTLAISMGNHLFRAAPAAKRGAERAAFADAEVKARNLASVAGLTVLAPLELAELEGAASLTGAFGDFGGVGATLGASAGSIGDDSGESLFAAIRTVAVRFRVRFATEPEA